MHQENVSRSQIRPLWLFPTQKSTRPNKNQKKFQPQKRLRQCRDCSMATNVNKINRTENTQQDHTNRKPQKTRYTSTHLGCHFRKLKAQSSNVSFATFHSKETFELWALSFERVFKNVTPSGILCSYETRNLLSLQRCDQTQNTAPAAGANTGIHYWLRLLSWIMKKSRQTLFVFFWSNFPHYYEPLGGAVHLRALPRPYRRRPHTRQQTGPGTDHRASIPEFERQKKWKNTMERACVGKMGLFCGTEIFKTRIGFQVLCKRRWEPGQGR